MFDLLFAPLKKGKRAVNQFFIFFKVIGRIFDGLKEDTLRVRDETNIATASPTMLPIHGQDRNMPRLTGESVEGYRTRLAMKGIISEWSGTRQGILYVLASLGYDHSQIAPVYEQDPSRWAEFAINLGAGSTETVIDISKIFQEVQAVKEASSKLAAFTIPTKTTCFSMQVGGTISCVVTLPVPELADHFDFQSAIQLGGHAGIQSVITIPEQK
nr:hypothetical protein [Pseudoflavonifractor sp. 60]